MIVKSEGLLRGALLLPLLCLSPVLAAEEATSVYSKASNDSLLWGAYRPNLYFGIRPRLAKSLSAGLMWSRVDDYQSVQTNFRHTCEQNEGMAGYGWDTYDPRLGGSQVIRDIGNGLDVTTDFVKFPDRGSNGGSWGVRISGKVRDGAPEDLKSTAVFYLALDGLGQMEVEDVEGDIEELGFSGDLRFSGQTVDLGDFEVVVREGKGRHAPVQGHPAGEDDPLDRTLVQSMQIPEAALWQTKSVTFSSMKATIDAYIAKYTEQNMPPPPSIYRIKNHPGVGNLHLIQKTFEGSFEFDVIYSQKSDGSKVSAADLTEGIDLTNKKIQRRFSTIHQPAAPFTTDRYQKLSRSLFSNLVGGIGYFQGDQLIDRSYAPEYEEENEGFWEETAAARATNQQKLEGPYELFTSTPSRPFFPRGFLWDEGLNLIPVLDWDIELTLQIVKSWFNTMDDDGWIPREQILGPEARTKVPEEFQVQYPHYANPPTLFLIVDTLLKRVDDLNAGLDHPFVTSGDEIKSYLADLYPLLKRQYEWFRRTQKGDMKSYDRTATSSKEAYRWRGRTVTHLLTSGLDDYPRAKTPHPGELHVDLISWVGLMTDVLHRLSSSINLADDAAEYASISSAIKSNVVDLHWSAEQNTFCDATVDEYEESVHVCHKGYISLFPFMLGLLDGKDDLIKASMDLLGDSEELWSQHGIRSLSKKDEFYGTAENYWRSPVWIPINYLVLVRLHDIATHPETNTPANTAQAKKLYTDLRKNLVETVYASWRDTGFAWEQYDPETGKGQRTQHFTGWTSLVVKIMAMEDLSGAAAKAAGGKEQVPIRDEL